MLRILTQHLMDYRDLGLCNHCLLPAVDINLCLRPWRPHPR